MRTVITMDGVQQMTEEEYAAYQRKLARQVITRMACFVGIKIVLFYAINRAAKAARES